MRTKHRMVSLAAAICVAAGLAGVAQAEPLRIFYFAWVGYGPLFLAQEKGFFAQKGVEVELINNEIHAAAFGGLFSWPGRCGRRRGARRPGQFEAR